MNHFRARVIVSEHDGVEIDVWDDELTPLKDRCRASEWALSHMQNAWSDEDYRDAFELPPTGIWEVVFDGKMRSWQDWEGEWDEEMEVLGIQKQQLPDDWYGPTPLDLIVERKTLEQLREM